MTKVKIEKFNIPKDVSCVTKALKDAGFESYLVGGCVRDLFMNKKPKDWDITTNANPEEITSLFPKTFYENKYGTVSVVNEFVSDETLRNIEVTPYRLDGTYSDHRRPDGVVFSQKIEDDLKRRDFTINAIAYDPENETIIDVYGGIADLAKKTIKTVGNPEDRFFEDGLRMLRAIRFHVELDFQINKETEDSIRKNSNILKNVSKERIRDELIKIIMSEIPMVGILKMKNLDVLQYIIPELEKSFGIEQNNAHKYDVGTHLLKSLQHSADKKYPLYIRLAAMLHDISKPETRRWSKESNQWTFYGHEVIGSRVTKTILTYLKFSRETIDLVSKLVRWHMFFSDTEVITHSAVRRIISNIGKENIWDLVNLRICDRIGTGRPKENPYRLRKYQSMIDEVMNDPVSVSMLKIDGREVMEILNIKPGPRIGWILNALLEEILDNPDLNNKDYLKNKVIELNKFEDEELKYLGEKGKDRLEIEEEKKIKEIRQKHKVS